jgi:hypothetical protein
MQLFLLKNSLFLPFNDSSRLSFVFPGSTMVKHQTHNPKIKASNPDLGNRREKMAKSTIFKLEIYLFENMIALVLLSRGPTQ